VWILLLLSQYTFNASSGLNPVGFKDSKDSRNPFCKSSGRSILMSISDVLVAVSSLHRY